MFSQTLPWKYHSQQNQVSFYYPHRSEVMVLRRLSLNIRKGQKVGDSFGRVCMEDD